MGIDCGGNVETCDDEIGPSPPDVTGPRESSSDDDDDLAHSTVRHHPEDASRKSRSSNSTDPPESSERFSAIQLQLPQLVLGPPQFKLPPAPPERDVDENDCLLWTHIGYGWTYRRYRKDERTIPSESSRGLRLEDSPKRIHYYFISHGAFVQVFREFSETDGMERFRLTLTMPYVIDLEKIF